MSKKKYHGITNKELMLLHELIKDKKQHWDNAIKKERAT